MVRSLIAQLLSDYDFGSPHPVLRPGVDLALIEGGDLAELTGLLGWLVRQLPEEVTLVIIVDGIAFYEREEFENPMLDVMGDLVGLTAASDVQATVVAVVVFVRAIAVVAAVIRLIVAASSVPEVAAAEPDEAEILRAGAEGF